MSTDADDDDDGGAPTTLLPQLGPQAHPVQEKISRSGGTPHSNHSKVHIRAYQGITISYFTAFYGILPISPLPPTPIPPSPHPGGVGVGAK